MTAQKFYQDFQTWNTQMTKYVEMLNAIQKQLNDIAARFAQADGQG
jgi:WXG100 family type VII secretion target